MRRKGTDRQTDRQKQLSQGRTEAVSPTKRSAGRGDAKANSHTLEFIGQHQHRRFLVLVDGCDLWLPRAELVALCQLAAARFVNSPSVILYRSVVSRLRKKINLEIGSDGVGNELILPTGRAAKGKELYFLAIPAAEISFDPSFREVLVSGLLDSATVQILIAALEGQFNKI